MSRLNPTQASVTAALIYVVGQVVAFVPSLSAEQQNLISIGTLVIAIVFAAIHLMHVIIEVVRDFAAGKAKVTLSDLEGGIRSFVRDEISKTDLTAGVEQVVAGKVPTVADLRGLMQSELRALLGAGTPPAPAPAAAAPAPPAQA
jgi:hypothetical protein